MKLFMLILPLITMLIGKMYVAGAGIDVSAYRLSASYYAPTADTVKFNQEKAIKELRKEIKGKEKLAAVRVFENIQSFERVSADRFLRIMELGFSQSLGVTCTHCHNPKDWSSDEKPQKQIARDMMVMVGKINSELLNAIDNLDSEKPLVNCTTCHRGQVKPALRIDR